MSVHPSRQAYVEEAEEENAGVDYNSLRTSNPVNATAGILTNLVATDSNYRIPATAPGAQSQESSAVLNDFARKRKAAALAVPTDDNRVREALRKRGEPITLFAERAEDRRDRLRELLYREQEAGEDTLMQDAGAAEGDGDADDDDDDDDGEFYTEGTQDLLHARQDMARYSIPRAQQRVSYQKIESQIRVPTHVKHRKEIKARLGGFDLYGSQIASQRPMSMVRFSPNGEMLAAGDWGGSLRILDVPNLETKLILRGHEDTIGGITWRPGATLPTSDVSADSVNLASSGAEGKVNLWSLTQDTPIATLSGHAARVCRTEFHPSGRYLASASYDMTWRLWDVETSTELLLQEGHSKEVYSVAFNDDGSLIVSAGLDSIGRVWDLRTGRTIMLLDSHVGPIYAADWSPDSCRIMTGSADGFAKTWDLRQVRETASLGAHKGGVSDLRWFKGTDGPLSGRLPYAKDTSDTTLTQLGPDEKVADPDVLWPKKSGTFIVSSGFDKMVNVTSADDWAPIKRLTGHDGTVLSTDVTNDARFIASCGRDRSVKLWARDDMEGI